MVEGNHKIDGGELAMFRLLQRKQRPTAVLTSNDLTAIGALRAIRLAGLRIPEDISVVGFDDIAFGEFNHPPLTTIRLSRAELGQKAFDALFHILHGELKKGKEYTVETHLVVRESTGSVASEAQG
jgi:LacI family transcriptional regulator